MNFLQDVIMKNYHICPEEIIEEISKVETILEDEIPSLDDSGEKWKEVYTPEKLREYEERMKKSGTIRYVLYTQEKDRTISGMTEIRYNPNDRPERVGQGLTGVLKEYRGKGLGKWLKAQMLVYIKDNYPEVKFIATGNAEHNAPMMSINNRMGFKAFVEEKSYKFDIKDTLTRLKKK